MPFSSSSLTRLASLNRGGGWVKCWSVSSFLRATTSPSVRGGGALRGGRDVHHRLVEDRRPHLGSHEAVPDQGVELELVLGQVPLDLFGIAVEVGGPDGLVGVLGALLAPVEVRLLGDVVLAVG